MGIARARGILSRLEQRARPLSEKVNALLAIHISFAIQYEKVIIMRLEQFYRDLKQSWAGSLVRVRHVRHRHAKEYLHQLAGQGLVERVAWGWYWVPAPIEDAWDFLAKDKNFKVVAGQTAASLWNGDFVHRDAYVVNVRDGSYGRALTAFGQSRGWSFQVEVAKPPAYTKMDGLLVETAAETVADCVRRWAFMDAFAVLRGHPRIDASRISRKYYWQRLPGTQMRIRPVLEYGIARLHGRETKALSDPYVQQEVDEAVEKVLELA